VEAKKMPMEFLRKREKTAFPPIEDLLSFIDAFASFSPAGEAEKRLREAKGAERGRVAKKRAGKPVHGAA
jgi:hypothetical protein